MRKPRVINIILSSSVKFTVNQVLWMWAYALAPVLRVLYSQLHFRFEFEQLSFSITLKCLLFSDFAVIISTKNIAIFGTWNVLQSFNLFFFFCVHILIVTPYLIVDKSLRFYFLFFAQLLIISDSFKFDMHIEIHQVINSSIYIITFIVILSSVDFTTLIKGGYSLLRTISAWNRMITSFRKQVIHNWM